MKNLSAEEALAIWQNEGKISPEQAAELLSSLEGKSDHIGVSKGIVLFATIGAVLVGLGILLFVSSNWDAMGPLQRVAVIFGSYIAIAIAAFATEKRGILRVAESLWFLLALSLGGYIFLLGQIFHYSLTYWQGPFLWMLGILSMGWARGRKGYGVAAVPLGLLALGWLGGGEGWFMDDQIQFLIDEGGLRPLLPLLGVGLVSLALLIRKKFSWMEGALMSWGVILISVPLILTTVDGDMLQIFEMRHTLKQILITGSIIVLVALALTKGDMHFDPARYTLLGVTIAGLLLSVFQSDNFAMLNAIGSDPVLFFLYVLAVFSLCLVTVWLGVRTANRHLVNAGVASVSVIIIIQYFSWTFEMLHSSIAFILGGIVLICLSIFMEKTRRKLLASIPIS